jgi:hypothetical protein
LVGGEGFGPSPTLSESAVLPVTLSSNRNLMRANAIDVSANVAIVAPNFQI